MAFHHPFQESQGLGEPTPAQPHKSLTQVKKGKRGVGRDDSRPVQECMTLGIEKEEGGCPEGPVASCGLPVLAQVELQGNEPLLECPGDVFMGDRFGIQPSAFRSRIFREVEEDGFSCGPAPFQGLIQILHPFKAHGFLWFFRQVLESCRSGRHALPDHPPAGKTRNPSNRAAMARRSS